MAERLTQNCELGRFLFKFKLKFGQSFEFFQLQFRLKILILFQVENARWQLIFINFLNNINNTKINKFLSIDFLNGDLLATKKEKMKHKILHATFLPLNSNSLNFIRV